MLASLCKPLFLTLSCRENYYIYREDFCLIGDLIWYGMPKDSGINLALRIVGFLLKGKRAIFLFTALTTVFIFVLALFGHDSFNAVAIIKPPQGGNNSSLDGAFKEASGGLGSLLGSLGSNSKSSENDCLNILGSSLFANLVIDRFDLEEVYELKGKVAKYYTADVIKLFRNHVDFEVTENEAIKIIVEDQSAERAQQMTTFIIQALDSVYSAMGKKNVHQNLAFIETRFTLVQSEIKVLEDSLVAFQLTHNLFLPEIQVQTNMENVAQTELEMELVKENINLEAVLRGTSGSHYKELVAKKTILEKAMVKKLDGQSNPASLLHAIHHVPDLVTSYLRLDRKYKVRLGVYKYLVQQMETLKLANEKNINSITVIDPPWVNYKTVSLDLYKQVLITFILSLFFSSTGVISYFVWKDKISEESRTQFLVNEIRTNLFKL